MVTETRPDNDPFLFCQAELRKTDPIRYFSLLTAPQEHRPALFALFSFAAEIERIPRLVSDPSLGEIRLQWWRDIVIDHQMDSETGCGAANIGPLATALKQTQRHYDLPSERLCQIIDAHRFDLYNDPMPDLATYETYAGETASLPLLLGCRILAHDLHPDEIADLCGHAGMALALGNHLMEWPDWAKTNRLVLPQSVFMQHEVAPADLFATQKDQRIAHPIKDLCHLATDHHVKALAHLRTLRKTGYSDISAVFLPLSVARQQIENRQRKPAAHLRQSRLKAYFGMLKLAGLG